MWLLAPDGEFDLRAEAREVSDVTGAGDTVIAAMALGLAGGGSLQQAARLANRAAGLAVSRFGPTAVSAAELRDAVTLRETDCCDARIHKDAKLGRLMAVPLRQSGFGLPSRRRSACRRQPAVMRVSAAPNQRATFSRAVSRTSAGRSIGSCR